MTQKFQAYVLAGASLLAMASPVFAQDVPAADSSSDGDIIVTAQRRAESLQRAAVAIAAVSGDDLSERGVTTPAELTALVPALTAVSAGGAASTFFVRGVGNFAVNGYTDPAIAFNYDSVYLGRATSSQGVMHDLQRVEVLKGPQGTLYGRNATSGAINVIPVRPQLGEMGGFLSGSFGNYDAVNLQGALNLPIGDDAAIRISGLHNSHDGYLTDGTSDDNTSALRIQGLVELTDTLTVRLATDYSQSRGTGAGSVYSHRYRFNRGTNSYIVTPSGFDNDVGLFDPAAQAFRQTLFSGLSGRTFTALDRRPQLNNDYFGVNAEIEWETPLGSLTIIPAHREADLDQTFTVPAFTAYLQEKSQQDSLELRLAGDDLGGFADYIVGAFFYHETVDGNYTFNQQSLAPFQDFTAKTSASAVFGRLTAHLSDSLRLVGGLRYTDESKSFDGASTTILVVCTVTVAFVPSCPTAPLIPTVDRPDQVGFAIPAGNGVLPIGTTGALAQRRNISVVDTLDTSKVNFRVALEYDIAPQSLFFASFENGFRSGGFALAPGHETYAPEYLDAYTIGVKNRFFDNRVLFNVEAFYWKFRDQQVTHPGIDSAGLQSNFTENIGRSTNKGFEIETQVEVTDDLRLMANVQYLDTNYSSFVYSVPVGNTPPFVGCPFTLEPGGLSYAINCSGRSAYNAPKWTVNLGAEQSLEFGDTEVVIQADTQYKSRRVVGFDYLDFQTIGSSWASNVQVSVTPGGGPVTLGAFVRNIENNRTPVASNGFGLGGVYTYNVSPPRTYGVRASVEF